MKIEPFRSGFERRMARAPAPETGRGPGTFRRLRKAAAHVTVPGLVLAGFLVLAAPTSPQAALTPPQDVVERLHGTLLNVMKAADMLGYNGRYAELAPVVQNSFDLPFMAKVVIGSSWRNLSADQQRQFVDAFTRMTISIYADRFNGYSGQKFETHEVKESLRDRMLVSTDLVRANGEVINLNYLVHPTEDGWAIIDVHQGGKFSELARRRSEFLSVMKLEGFPGLIAAIETRIRTNEGNG